MDTKTLSLKFPLRPPAILIDVELIVSAIIGKQEKPVSIKTKALVDTGANGSCISQRLVSACRLKPISAMKMISAHGVGIAQVYETSIILPTGITFSAVPVVEVAGSKSFDVIIGMDILTKCDFAFSSNGKESCFSMRIPSANALIDFTKEQKPFSL